MREGVIALDIEKLHQMAAARPGVDADRQVELFGPVINRKEIGIVQGQVAFHAAKENSHRAVCFRPFHFLQGGAPLPQRQNGDPFEPLGRLRAGGGGKRCEQRGWLQLHHDNPFARGGTATLENIRVLCAPHNRLLAERDYGRAFVQRHIDIARRKPAPS